MSEAPAERPAPSATGTLAARPLLHLLVYARNRHLTGRLDLQAADGRTGSIELWRGRIRDARTVPAVAYFGALAYELGHIDTATLDATLLEIATTKRLHGEVLVERGALTSALRDAVLSEQACRKIHSLFSLPPEATFSFYEARPGTDDPPLQLDPIKPAWRGLREHPPLESVKEVLTRFANRPLRMANEGPIGRAGLDDDELALCDALTWRPLTVAQLHAGSSLPASRVELLVYLLVITKCAEPATASSPGMPAAPDLQRSIRQAPASDRSLVAAATTPAAPRVSANMAAAAAATPRASGSIPCSPRVEPHASLSFRVPSAPALRSAGGSSSKIASQAPVFSPADLGAVGIAHRAQQVDTEDPFTALGLEHGASIEAARAAYFRLNKLWHPDRLPSDLEPFRVEVERVYAHMTRAHRTLTELELRGEYDARAGSGAVPLRDHPSVQRPRNIVLREIEQMIAKREFHAAEAASREMTIVNADDADAIALGAWAAAFAGEGAEDTLRAALPALDRAVSNDRDCERAFYYRGVVHKRLGSNASAFRDFARVVALNPKHVDAQREVRIFEMRARKGSGEHKLDALISKAKKR